MIFLYCNYDQCDFCNEQNKTQKIHCNKNQDLLNMLGKLQIEMPVRKNTLYESNLKKWT